MQCVNDSRGDDPHPAFSGVMIKCGDKVLLCKRREDIPNTALPDYWSVPAGYVEPDEEIKTAAEAMKCCIQKLQKMSYA